MTEHGVDPGAECRSLEIRFFPESGAVQLVGPLSDIDLCYMLLNRGRLALDQRALGLSGSRPVALARGPLPPPPARGS